MSRPDPSIAFLRRHGFSIFRIPRASAQPLELLHRQGKDLTRLGQLPDLVSTGAVALPAITRDDRPGIDIEGQETGTINAAIGVSLLGSFIGALGGGSIGLQAGFKDARTVTFSYVGVAEDRVDVLALEKFVAAGTVSPHVPPGTLEKLLDDEVYVVTSVLKSRKIAVRAQAAGGQSVQIDVPVIQEAVGGSVNLDRTGEHDATIAFEGAVPVGFAFQAVQLVFADSGEFLTTMQLAAGDAAARGVVAAESRGARPAPRFLESRGAFVRVDP